jgi:hypothetical protein
LKSDAGSPQKTGPLEKFLGPFYAFSRTLVATPELECHSKENGEKRNTRDSSKRSVINSPVPELLTVAIWTHNISGFSQAAHLAKEKERNLRYLILFI